MATLAFSPKLSNTQKQKGGGVTRPTWVKNTQTDKPKTALNRVLVVVSMKNRVV